jgi:hypothetical protein
VSDSNPKRKRKFSGFTLREALALHGTAQLWEWLPPAEPKPPSAHFRHTVEKLKAHFDLALSESAKSLMIDAVLLEAVDDFPALKIWKEAALQTDELTGNADYLVAGQGAVYQAPLLCVVEAKKDDFEQGLAQCLAELRACQDINRAYPAFDLYGVVTNASTWRFYKLDPEHRIHASPTYAETQIELVLGILHGVFSECSAHLAQTQSS